MEAISLAIASDRKKFADMTYNAHEIASIYSSSFRHSDCISHSGREVSANSRAAFWEIALKTKVLLLVTALVVVGSGTLMADSIPYGNIGTQVFVPSSSTFTATETGLITAYFFGSDAGYTSVLGMSVNGGEVGVWGLNNHSSAYGNSLALGTVNAGDVITFLLYVYDLNSAWSSDQTQNADGLNHVYVAAFGGDSTIPTGTYVGFEDLYGGGDNDYNDEQFVFTTTATVVPEPGAFALLGIGALFATSLRKKLAA